MPNYCNYKTKLKGEPSSIREFIDIMKNNTDHEGPHMYRIFAAEVIDESEIDKGFAHIDGYCAWSVYSCMMEGEHTYYDKEKEESAELGKQFNGTSLIKESKRLSLSIEIYSEEPGFGFEEHIYIINGDIVEYEVADMSEISLGDFKSVKELNEKLGLSISKEYFEKEEYLKVGGFGEFVFN